MNTPRLLVVGGSGGIGKEVVKLAQLNAMEVVTAGVEREYEDLEMDLNNGAEILSRIRTEDPFDHVVVASGVNALTPVGSMNLYRHMKQMMDVNCVGPMILLQGWIKRHASAGHFVVVSSNSAHIPRTKSMAYCASKAALSMAVRVAARECVDTGATIWGVEPGWVEGTRMSHRMRSALPASAVADGVPKMHRIPGDRVNYPEGIAQIIVDGIVDDRKQYNGCLLRIDGGEI